MAIKVIVELRAKPGMRDELEELLVSHVPDEPVPGYLGSTRYEASTIQTCWWRSRSGSHPRCGWSR